MNKETKNLMCYQVDSSPEYFVCSCGYITKQEKRLLSHFDKEDRSKPMDLKEAFKQVKENPDNVKAIHIGSITQLTKEANKAQYLKKVKGIEPLDTKPLERIESMLSAIIAHLNIPYKGILKG